MTNTPKKVFSRLMVRPSFVFAESHEVVLERGPKTPSKDYLDAIQAEIDAKLGSASDRKPAGPSGW